MNSTILFASLWVFMVAGDLVTTFIGLNLGLTEGNYFAAWVLVNFGMAAFLAFSFVGKVAMFNILAWLHKNSCGIEDRILGFSFNRTKSLELVVLGLLAIHVFVFFWNSFLIANSLGVFV